MQKGARGWIEGEATDKAASLLQMLLDIEWQGATAH